MITRSAPLVGQRPAASTAPSRRPEQVASTSAAAPRRPVGVDSSAMMSAPLMSTPITVWPDPSNLAATAAPIPDAEPVTA